MFKNDLTLEDYLSSDDFRGRRIMTSIRSGANQLRIDSDRRKKVPRNERVCWFGCEEIEDESHVLLRCWMYDDLRKDFASRIGNEEFARNGLSKMLGRGSQVEIDAAITFLKMALARRKRILNQRG